MKMNLLNLKHIIIRLNGSITSYTLVIYILKEKKCQKV